MARRTGLWTLRQVAYRFCRLAPKFRPIIVAVYPDATALHLAMDALMAACDEFVTQADTNLPTGT